MDGFTFYDHAAGYDWYQCKCCGALSIGRPVKCPVCEGKAVQHTQEADFKGVDTSQRRLRELIDKYAAELSGNSAEPAHPEHDGSSHRRNNNE